MHPAPDIVCKRFSADFSPFPWLCFYYSRYRSWFPCGISAEKSESLLYQTHVRKPFFSSFIVCFTYKMVGKQSKPAIYARIFRRDFRRFIFQGIKKEPTTFTVIGSHTYKLPVQRIKALALQVFICCDKSVTALRPEDVHECGMTRIILIEHCACAAEK